MSSTLCTDSEKEFGVIRSCIWPIHRHELRKLIPMILMIAFVCFNYGILRNMKDTVVVTTSGAEVIPFIKVWAMLPGAVLLTCLFTRLSNRFSQESVLYIMISGFLLFFGLFAFVLYPLRDVIHPHAFADKLQTLLPTSFSGFISMLRYWTFTGFYVLCELWGGIVLNVLFWGFANEVTRIEEARRFYSVFGIGANIAAIVAGQAAIFFTRSSEISSWLPFGTDPWEQSQMTLMCLIIVVGIAIMGIFRWINRNVLTDPSFDEFHQIKRESKKKGKTSFTDSFAYLSNSKYLICIAALVICYNLVINLVEVVWKDQLRRLYPDPSDFNTYLNNLTSAIGIVSTLLALFLAKIIARFGWTKAALITPVIMLVTCGGFFSFMLFRDHWAEIVIGLTGTTPLAIAVFFGGAQNCLSKAAKYSVFDATKEIAYIPLSHECKLKGKAAIDGVGSRLGKSGGSFIHQGLLMIFSTLTASAPYVAGIIFIVILFWISAARILGRKFNDLVDGKGSTETLVSSEIPITLEQTVKLAH